MAARATRKEGRKEGSRGEERGEAHLWRRRATLSGRGRSCFSADHLSPLFEAALLFSSQQQRPATINHPTDSLRGLLPR